MPTGSTGADPVISATAWTTARVNLRSGPSTSNTVLWVVPLDAKLGTSPTVKNGFRYVSYNGQAGWTADAYISATPPDDQYGEGPVPNYQATTGNLNLRAEPSLSARILTVIPAGSRVKPNGSLAYNFARVTWNGMTGWVSISYLK